MKRPYRWIGSVLGIGLILALASAQLFVRQGFNDPVTLVDQMMSEMPRSLSLTAGQRKQMRRIYIDLSREEQRIYFQPGSSFVKRGQVKRLDDEANHKVLLLLGSRKFEAVQRWMHKMHHPTRGKPRVGR